MLEDGGSVDNPTFTTCTITQYTSIISQNVCMTFVCNFSWDFWRVKEVYYGICASNELVARFSRQMPNLMLKSMLATMANGKPLTANHGLKS